MTKFRNPNNPLSVDNYIARPIKEVKATCVWCSGKGWYWELTDDDKDIKSTCQECNGQGWYWKEV